MEQTHGTWGERLVTFKWDGGLTTLLFLEPYQECSWHHHRASWNQFTVVSGKLGVETDKGHTTVLTEKQCFTTEPGVRHKFITYAERAIIEEIAYTRYDPNDIVREKLGGPTNELCRPRPNYSQHILPCGCAVPADGKLYQGCPICQVNFTEPQKAGFGVFKND